MLRFAGLLCCAVLGGLALPRPAGAAEATLRFGSINAAGTASYEEILVPLARAIEAASGNRLAIDLKPMGGFGKPIELLPMVEAGQIEIAATVQGYQPGRFPRSSVMELPLIFETAETGSDAFWSLYAEGLFGPEYDAFKVLGLYVVAPYGIFVVPEQKVASLRDLRGLRIRVPSVTLGLALGRLGAIPIGLPGNLISNMLHEQLIDGIAYGWESTSTSTGFDGKPYAAQLRDMVDTNLAAPALMVVMNRKAYDALPADLRQVIDGQSGRDFVRRTSRLRDEAEAKAKQMLSESADHHMVKLDDAERRELRQRITPVYDDWIATMQRDGIDGAALLARARALGAHS
jgi:TRAP-type C4-dicarboxylate transport system substrate-binding protein